MMTVFFYSGITSYPGVSTEEKTIISYGFDLKNIFQLKKVKNFLSFIF